MTQLFIAIFGLSALWMATGNNDTAPKEGKVLLYWPEYDPWGCEEPQGPRLAIGEWKLNPRIDAGYFSDSEEWDDYGLVDVRPSHWMPLPDAPND